jgi:hypothetical protein
MFLALFISQVNNPPALAGDESGPAQFDNIALPFLPQHEGILLQHCGALRIDSRNGDRP